MAAPLKAFPGLPPAGGSPREVATVVNRLMQAKMNCVIEVTLTANSNTTTVSDPRLSEQSVPIPVPLDIGAWQEGTPYISGRQQGECTLNHSNKPATTRTFALVIIG